MSTAAPIRVMVVDDSAIVRGLIARTLKADPRIEFVASCSNGEMAVVQAAKRPLDVIILDIEMPVMDGLTALPKLQQVNPQARIIMASTLTQRNAGISLRAMALGAADYIAKPTTDRLNANEEFHRDLIQKVIVLGESRKIAQSRTALPRSPERSPLPLRGGMVRRPRIIAIGSSTGGPQALLTLLGALSPTVNCPIVIAQHMPATFTTVLAQHIERGSGRPCAEARHGMEIKPGAICLAPGDYHFQVARDGAGCIAHLSQTAPENFCRPSVDPLFRSVAQAFGAESCAVMLTGMGSDGCGGAKIMAAAGAPVIAQDEATSVVWGMPGAVAQAGICSAILPLPQIAGHLAAMFEKGRGMTSADFTFIAAFLKERSGLIITPDKMYLLETRLGPILRERGLSGLPALMDVLRQPGASPVKDKVVDAMTTNETSFFRDSHPFDALRKSIIPGLIERRAATKTLRIWSAACSTGQEPYSLAMILKDHFPILGGWKVEIVATDLSPSVLERAREGHYSTFEVQRGMPIQMLVRHFDQCEPVWQVKRELRQMVTFRPLNLLEDFSVLGTFDVVLCRNVLIYFDQPTKTRILNAIARRIAQDGALLLGGAESVFGLCDAFTGVPGLKGVYGHTKQINSAPQPLLRLSAAS